ncbi:MAG: hypothetical protein MRZ61_02540 [Oscillospiraceae bacterium]|nr:hypothetical protein [Oscillospiraceae bacterium]
MGMSGMFEIETNMMKADSVEDCLKANEVVVCSCEAACSSGIFGEIASLFTEKALRKCVLAVTNLRVICFSDGCAQFLTPYHFRGVNVRNKGDGAAELHFIFTDYDEYDMKPAFFCSPLKKIDIYSAEQAAEAANRLIHK